MRLTYFNTALLLAPALAQAAGPHPWRPVPTNLWAVQAFVPPGTNDTRAVQVVPAGIAVPLAGGTPSAGGPPAPNAPPIVGPGGQVQPLPPGIPAGAAPGASGRSAAPATPTSPGATAPAIAGTVKAPVCEVTLRVARIELPSTGGEFALPVVLKPAACPASVAVAAPWLKPMDASRLRFVAEPNSTSATREAVILIGKRFFVVRQVAPIQPGLAAAPSRLVFAVDAKGQSAKKVLSFWSEKPSSNYVARSRDAWLTVTPKRGKQALQMYEVSIQPNAALAPGRHDTTIELSAGGTPDRFVTVPVVVEVEGLHF